MLQVLVCDSGGAFFVVNVFVSKSKEGKFFFRLIGERWDGLEEASTCTIEA